MMQRNLASYLGIVLLGAGLTACGGTDVPADEVDSTTFAATAPTTTWIYRDALVSPWVNDSSARSHVNLANTSPVAAGTRSISTHLGAYRALSFVRSAFSASSYSSFVLSVHGGTSGGGAVLMARAVLRDRTWTPGVTLGQYCTGGSIVSGAWRTCRVPMSAIAPAGATLIGVLVQEAGGMMLPTLYFDEIGLEPVAQQSVVVAVAPKTVSVIAGRTQAFTCSVTGSTNTACTWSASGGSITSAGVFTAPATAGTYVVTARSSADTTKTDTATVTVTAAPVVAVAVSPATASVDACHTQAFTCSVTGSTNTGCTWSVTEATGGNVTSSGTYTAPDAAGIYHVVARSNADATKTATATVTVSERILSIAVTPASVSVTTSGTQQFVATVTTTCGSFTQTAN